MLFVDFDAFDWFSWGFGGFLVWCLWVCGLLGFHGFSVLGTWFLADLVLFVSLLVVSISCRTVRYRF